MNVRTVTLLVVFILSCSAVAQTGGNYDLSHNVIASGGGSRSLGGTYSVDGTSGQGIAGTISTGDEFSLRGGFWAFQELAPTAAGVSVGGRIRTADGRTIPNVVVTLANASTGSIVFARSSSLGYYRFDDVEVGQTYILSVAAKQFAFEPSFRVISVLDELTDEDFTAVPE